MGSYLKCHIKFHFFEWNRAPFPNDDRFAKHPIREAQTIRSIFGYIEKIVEWFVYIVFDGGKENWEG